MTIKPFAIQGSDLTLGGVNLQAGTDTIVIPGVTQATNYFAEEVNEYGSDNNQDFGSQEGAITIIDNAGYVYRSGGAQPSGAYVHAEYSVDELDDGNIEAVQVEVAGTFAAADKTRAEAANMWATLTPTPFVSFNADNWGQIPFRPKIRAGAVQNVGGGSGGVVERSIEFPAGEEGDTAGTLALNPMGSLFICTADWTDADDINKTFDGEAVRDFAASQSGFVYNFIELLVADHPGLETILNTLGAAGVNYQTDFTVNGGSNFGGAQTISQIGFGNNSTEIVIGWPHRTGVDPTTIDQGDEFIVIYTGTVPQPAIWQQVNTGNTLGDLTVENGDTITNSSGDVQLSADEDILIEAGDDIRIDADDEVSIRTYGTGSGNYVEIVTGYDSNEEYKWKFDTDGNLTLPAGGDILDSNGDSVLGGAGSDPRVWVQTFVTDTPTTDFPQLATSVEYDADGNVIALFTHLDISGEEDSRYYSVGKYTPTGSKIWAVRFDVGFNTDGWGLAVDSVDDWIYIAGSTSSDGATASTVSTLTKIDGSTGGEEWSKVYDFGFESSSAVVDVDSDGQPIMVGYVDLEPEVFEQESYLTITKVNKTNGNVTWSRKLDGQADERAYGMAVGPNDEVVAVGYMDQFGATDGAATLYTAPLSNANWTINQTGVFNGTAGVGIQFDVSFTAGVPTFSNIVDTEGGRVVDDTVATILGSVLGGVDGTDNMVIKVATVAANDTDDRMVVVKYLDDGSIVWQKAIQFDADWNCSGADADIDSAGNIYICGQYDIDNVGFTGQGIGIVKLNSSGVKQWSRRVEGDCISLSTSIVVGPDDKLYISGVTGYTGPGEVNFTWVVAKYGFDGLVEWQRLIDNTTAMTFAGTLFLNSAGGSNLAVRQGYVALAGGFGDLAQEFPEVYAAVVQVPATGNVFTVGNWDFTAASFTGSLNSSASDITVVNARLIDSNNVSAISSESATPQTDNTNFLVGTLFTAPASGSNELVNGEHVFALESDGTLTLDGDPFNGNGFLVLADGTLQANVEGNATTLTSAALTSKPTWLTITPRSPDRNTLDTHYGFDSTGMWFTGNNEETFDDSPAYPIHTTDSFPADVKVVVEFEIDYNDGEEDWGICVYPADGVPHWSWNPHPSRIAGMIDIGDGDLSIYGFTDSTFSSLNNPNPGTYTARFTYDPIAELTTFEIEDSAGVVFSRCQQPGRLARDQDYRIGFDADWDNAGVGEKSYFTGLTITSGNTTDAKPTELTATGEIKLPSTVKGFINIQGPWANNDDSIQFQSVAAHNGYAYMIGEAQSSENNRIRIDKYSLNSGELVWTRVLGAGRNAVFDISWTGGAYTLTDISNGGTGYQAGQLVYISADSIVGGQSPDNLVTITVTGVNSSGAIQTATIGGTAPSGTSSQVGLTEYNSDANGDPTSIKYDTVTDTLVVLTDHYTAIGDANDSNWNRALVTRINPVSGDVISTVTLSDEGDIYPYDVAVHPTTGATAVVGEKRNEYRAFGTLTMANKGIGYFDILKSELDAEHYPGSNIPGEYPGDFWISGTGAPNREWIDNVNYYDNLATTVRQGTGATFNITNNGNGTYTAAVTAAVNTNYRVGHKIKVLGTALTGQENTTSYGAAEYGGGYGAWKVTDDGAGNTYLIFPQPAGSTAVTGLLSVGDAIIIEWSSTEHTTTIAAALGAVPNDPYIGSFPNSVGYRLTDNFSVTGQPDLNVGYVIIGNGTYAAGATPDNDIIITVDAVTDGAITSVSNSGTAAGTSVATTNAVSGTNYQVGSGFTLNIEVDSVTGSRIANVNLGGSNYVANDVAYISGSEFANGSDGWEILSGTTSGWNGGEAFFSKSTYPTLNTTLLAVTVGAIAKFPNGATARVNVIRTADPSNWGVTFTVISGSLPNPLTGPISFFANDVEVTIVSIGEAGGNVTSAVTAGSTPTNILRIFVNGVDFTAVGGSWTMSQDLDGEAFVWTPTWNKAIGGASNDQFQSVVYSKDGASIYAVGSGQYEVTYSQSLVVKYATSDGTIGFSKYLNSDTVDSYATGVATIGTSDIVVSGYERNTIIGIDRDQQFVARLTSSGTVVWKKFYGDGNWTNILDHNCDIQVDSDDNIYVTMAEGADNPSFTSRGFTVTKLDQDGNLVWTRCVSGQASSYLTNWAGNRFSSLANDQLVVAGYTQMTDQDYDSGLWVSFPTDGFTYLGGESEFVQQGAFRFSPGRIKNGVITLDTGGSFTPSVQAPTITASNNIKKFETRDPIIFFEQHLHKMVDPKHGGVMFGDGSRQTFATDKIPQIKANYDHTITAQDSGKHIYYKNHAGTVYIPLWADVKLPVGFTFTIVNHSGGDCYVQLTSWPGPRGTILGSGRNANYHTWGIPDSGSGSMVTLLLLEAGQDLGDGHYHEPVWMISGPDDIYPDTP